MVLTLILGYRLIFKSDLLKAEETMYCHFENNVTEPPLNRFECINMKIASKHLEKIDFMQFDRLNLTYYKCASSYPQDCNGEHYYFSLYSLSDFTNDRSMDGYNCVAHYITYYVDDETKIDYYENTFAQEIFEVKDDLDERFRNCKG